MPASFVTDLSPTDWKLMARKTNYGFERREREKARAEKKAERQRQKQDKSDDRKDDDDPSQISDVDYADAETGQNEETQSPTD